MINFPENETLRSRALWCAGRRMPPGTRMSPTLFRPHEDRPEVLRGAGRGAEVDQPGLRREVGGGEGGAEADAERLQLLRAEPGVVDPAGVLGAAGLGRLA